jgi:predicted dehydrogenase
MQPYHENLVHYNWHWFWDFGNGELGNNGIHMIDILRWGMRKTLPVRSTRPAGAWA